MNGERDERDEWSCEQARLQRAAAARLAAWASAWLAGACSFDTALDAVTSGAEHHVEHVGGVGEPALGRVITSMRTAGRSAVRLALPVPGDLGFLPAHEDFRRAALDAGAACVTVSARGTPRSELGLVPSLQTHGTPEEGFVRSVTWTVYDVAEWPASAYCSLSEADRGLKEATREATETLLRLDVARLTPAAAASLDVIRRRARSGGPARDLPPGYPSRAADVLARADQLDAVVALALGDTGGALTSAEVDVRRTALRDVSRMARVAVMAAYNCYGIEPAGGQL